MHARVGTDSSEYKTILEHLIDVIDNTEYDFKENPPELKDAAPILHAKLLATLEEFERSCATLRKQLKVQS